MLYSIIPSVLWAVVAAAQPCPQVTAHLYGPTDKSCAGSYSSFVLQNFSCVLMDGGFAALKFSRINAPNWADDCFLINVAQNYCPWYSGSYVPSIYTPSNGTNGNTVDYATCLPTLGNPNGHLPTLLELYCIDTTGNVVGCGPSSSTTTTKSSSSSSSTSSSSTTTTTPVKTSPTSPPSTPSPTNTMTPNPYVITAVSKASSALSVANRSISAYSKNNTAVALASAVESAIVSAAVVNQDALNIASDYSASDIVSQLQNVDNILVNATACAISAQMHSNLAAAIALLAAFGPVFASVAAAIAAAANPKSNPAPAQPPKTTKTYTTSSTSTASCTLCFGCSERALVVPSPIDTGVGPGSAPLDPTTTTSAAISKRTLDPLISTKCSGRGVFCQNCFSVPTYTSSGKGKYTTYYNYYASFDCATYDFKFGSSLTGTLPLIPSNLQQVTQSYATEHIYEIQQVSIFAEYARQNDPVLQQKDGRSPDNSIYCSTGLGMLMSNARKFVTPSISPYDTSVAPIQQVYSVLDGAGGASEFVYLESGVNSLKGVFFKGQLPRYSSFDDIDTLLALATRTYMVNEYLNEDMVATIYRTVSNRVRQQFVNFGQACSVSPYPAYSAYGAVQWERDYNNWEVTYLNGIQYNMANVIYECFVLVDAKLKNNLRNPGYASKQQLEAYETLKGWIFLEGRGLDVSVSLSKLLTGPRNT